MDRLSESLEDYLEVIAELSGTDGHAHVKEIADQLHVKMPSVTGALRQLARLNYITYSSHQPVVLTALGKSVADRVIARHQILKKFFCDILGMSSVKASEVACKLEHIIDDPALTRFVLFTEAIATRTDALLLKSYLTEATANLEHAERPDAFCVLSDVPAGNTVLFDRVGRGTQEKVPFKRGDMLFVESIALDHSRCTVLCGKKSMVIQQPVAEHLWCIRGNTKNKRV